MDHSLSLLHSMRGILRLSTTTASIIPSRRVLADLLALLPDGPLAQAISDLAMSPAPTLDTLPALSQAARELDAQLARVPGAAAQLLPLHEALCAVIAAATIVDAGTPATLDLRISGLPALRYIEQIRMPTRPGDTPTVIVGPGEARVTFAGSTYITSRIQLTYGESQLYPRLRMRTPSRCPDDPRPIERNSWIQKPREPYDLEIYTHSRRYKGRIHTRDEPLPLSLVGAGLQLTFPTQAASLVLITTISDEEGEPLGRCLRLLPPQLAPSA
ncbi:MAG: hypothetical protein OHK0015_54940 [Chloroflexi bacterium OHK40]